MLQRLMQLYYKGQIISIWLRVFMHTAVLVNIITELTMTFAFHFVVLLEGRMERRIWKRGTTMRYIYQYLRSIE